MGLTTTVLLTVEAVALLSLIDQWAVAGLPLKGRRARIVNNTVPRVLDKGDINVRGQTTPPPNSITPENIFNPSKDPGPQLHKPITSFLSVSSQKTANIREPLNHQKDIPKTQSLPLATTSQTTTTTSTKVEPPHHQNDTVDTPKTQSLPLATTSQTTTTTSTKVEPPYHQNDTVDTPKTQSLPLATTSQTATTTSTKAEPPYHQNDTLGTQSLAKTPKTTTTTSTISTYDEDTAIPNSVNTEVEIPKSIENPRNHVRKVSPFVFYGKGLQSPNVGRFRPSLGRTGTKPFNNPKIQTWGKGRPIFPQGLRVDHDSKPINIDIPKHEGLKMPKHEGLKMPKHEGLKMSKHEGLKMPKREGLKMPKHEGLKMPKHEGLKMPKHEGLKMPKHEGLKMPKHEGLKMLPKGRDFKPVKLEKGNKLVYFSKTGGQCRPLTNGHPVDPINDVEAYRPYTLPAMHQDILPPAIRPMAMIFPCAMDKCKTRHGRNRQYSTEPCPSCSNPCGSPQCAPYHNAHYGEMSQTTPTGEKPLRDFVDMICKLKIYPVSPLIRELCQFAGFPSNEVKAMSGQMDMSRNTREFVDATGDEMHNVLTDMITATLWPEQTKSFKERIERLVMPHRSTAGNKKKPEGIKTTKMWPDPMKMFTDRTKIPVKSHFCAAGDKKPGEGKTNMAALPKKKKSLDGKEAWRMSHNGKTATEDIIRSSTDSNSPKATGERDRGFYPAGKLVKQYVKASPKLTSANWGDSGPIQSHVKNIEDVENDLSMDDDVDGAVVDENDGSVATDGEDEEEEEGGDYNDTDDNDGDNEEKREEGDHDDDEVKEKRMIMTRMMIG